MVFLPAVQLVVTMVLGMEEKMDEQTAGWMVGSRVAKRVERTVGLMAMATVAHSACCWEYAMGSCLVGTKVRVLDETSVEC